MAKPSKKTSPDGKEFIGTPSLKRNWVPIPKKGKRERERVATYDADGRVHWHEV